MKLKLFKHALLIIMIVTYLGEIEVTNSALLKSKLTSKSTSSQELIQVQQTNGFYNDMLNQSTHYTSPEIVIPRTSPLGHLTPTAMISSINTATTLSSPTSVIPSSCGCAKDVRCEPCNSVYVAKVVSPSCECAPKPACPACPPLSLIHDMAMQKANRDAQIASRVSSITFQLNMHLKKVSQLSNEIASFEAQARDAANKMEESFRKAQLAKSMMITSSNQAKMVASATLSNTRLNIDLNVNQPMINPDLNIFPEEVTSIGDYVQKKAANNQFEEQEVVPRTNLRLDDGGINHLFSLDTSEGNESDFPTMSNSNTIEVTNRTAYDAPKPFEENLQNLQKSLNDAFQKSGDLSINVSGHEGQRTNTHSDTSHNGHTGSEEDLGEIAKELDNLA